MAERGGLSTRILSCSDDIRVWKYESNESKLLSSFQPRKKKVTAARWNHNSQLIASASPDGGLYLSVPTGKEAANLTSARTSTSRINDIVFSSRSQFLCTGGEAKHLEVWEVTKKSVIRILEGHKAAVNCMCFGRADMLLASGADDGRVLIHNVKHNTMNQLAPDRVRSEASTSPVSAIRFAHVRKNLVGATSDNGYLRIWDSNTSKIVITFKNHIAPATGFAFSKKHRALVCSCSFDQTLRFFDMTKGKNINITSVGEPLTSLDFNNDGQTVVLGTIKGNILTYDLRNIHGGPLHKFKAYDTRVSFVEFASNSNRDRYSLSTKGASILEAPSTSLDPSYKRRPQKAGSSSALGSGRLDLSIDSNLGGMVHGSNKGSDLSNADAIVVPSATVGVGVDLDLSMDIGGREPSNPYHKPPLSSGSRHNNLNFSFDTTTSDGTTGFRKSGGGRGKLLKSPVPRGGGRPSSTSALPTKIQEEWSQPGRALNKGMRPASSQRSGQGYRHQSLGSDSLRSYSEQKWDETDSPERRSHHPKPQPSVRPSPKSQLPRSNGPTPNGQPSTFQVPASRPKPGPARPTIATAPTGDAKSFQIQLMRSTMEEVVSKVHEELQEQISQLHVEILRQFHIQHETMRNTISDMANQITELKEEIKALREY
ncbi:hypothetical protein AAMO2058_000852500 [Amorphochlora amoebiformis]